MLHATVFTSFGHCTSLGICKNPHMYLLHKTSSRPSRNPRASRIQDCCPLESQLLSTSLHVTHTEMFVSTPLSLSQVTDQVPASWPPANILGSITKLASSLSLNVKMGCLRAAWQMAFLREIFLIPTCEEEEGERKQGRKKGIERETRGSRGKGATTAVPFL